MLIYKGTGDRQRERIVGRYLGRHTGPYTAAYAGKSTHIDIGAGAVFESDIQTEGQFEIRSAGIAVGRTGLQVCGAARSGRVTQYIQQNHVAMGGGGVLLSFEPVACHIGAQRLALDIRSLVFYREVEYAQRFLARLDERYIVYRNSEYRLAQGV